MEQESKTSILIKAFFSRITNIISSPGKEWYVIKSENPSKTSLFVYTVIMSLIPFLSIYIKYAIIGNVSYPEGNPIEGLKIGGYSFFSSIIVVYLLAWFLDFRAPAFEAEKNFRESLQLVVYSFTPYWLAGLIYIFGEQFTAVIQFIGLYSIYMIYLGLPILKDTKSTKIVGYVINYAIALLVLRVLSAYLFQNIILLID